MNAEKRKIRIVIGSVGVDPHDLGMKIIANTLREAGTEVIYLGRFLTPEKIVNAAIQENVDLIGLSDHCGAMPLIASEVLDLLKKKGANSIRVVAGGLLSDEDIKALDGMGVAGNWRGGAPLGEIVDSIAELMAKN